LHLATRERVQTNEAKSKRRRRGHSAPFSCRHFFLLCLEEEEEEEEEERLYLHLERDSLWFSARMRLAA